MKSCNQLNYLPLEYSDDIEDSDTNIVPATWSRRGTHSGKVINPTKDALMNDHTVEK